MGTISNKIDQAQLLRPSARKGIVETKIVLGKLTDTDRDVYLILINIPIST